MQVKCCGKSHDFLPCVGLQPGSLFTVASVGAGEFVKTSCTISHTLGQCEKCHEGTFTRASNGLESCILCSSCDERQEMVAECSATSDRKCQCQVGHFYSDPKSYEVCRLCTKCPQGIPVLQACNATANTVCGHTTTSKTDHRNWLWLILLVFPVVIAVCCYLKKKRSCRCPSDKLAEGTSGVSESTEDLQIN
ncbi:tumor necrosis factor receptor superfamily member 23-like isoform X3 [Peromyscus leucopus]|uniref:tumor necrosis factor receptor superfamily member 23-like isoform X3 n=1 Tax=Peromyscus leucopus TaxID=10041 RepID=UPI0010A1E344|nr:tumor necrosis factor receptor superfamily member 23-like isoform X3 [Peromyscus leucopus]